VLLFLFSNTDVLPQGEKFIPISEAISGSPGGTTNNKGSTKIIRAPFLFSNTDVLPQGEKFIPISKAISGSPGGTTI